MKYWKKLIFLNSFFVIASCFAQQGKMPNQKAFQQLSDKILKYPSQVNFFDNQAVQSLIKQTIPLAERRLIKSFVVESPIEVIAHTAVNKYVSGDYTDYAFIINTCKPHDCDENYLLIYLARNYYGHAILIAYFYETNKGKTIEKWFTPLASCNINKNLYKYHKQSEKEWMISLKKRLQCIQENKR